MKKIISLIILLSFICGLIFIAPDKQPIEVSAESGGWNVSGTIWASGKWEYDNTLGMNRYKFTLTNTSGWPAGVEAYAFCQNDGLWAANGVYVTGTYRYWDNADGTRRTHQISLSVPNVTNPSLIVGQDGSMDAALHTLNNAMAAWNRRFNKYIADLNKPNGDITEEDMRAAAEYAETGSNFHSIRENFDRNYGNVQIQRIGDEFTITLYYTQQAKRTWYEDLTGKLAVNKTSDRTDLHTTYSLVGAQFTVYTDSNCTTVAKDSSGNNAVYTIGSDNSGGTKTFKPGTYYIKETKAPTCGMYEIDTAVKRVVINAGDNKSETFTNTMKKGKIKVKKEY